MCEAEGEGEGWGEGEDTSGASLDAINYLQQFLSVPAAQMFGLKPAKDGKVTVQIPGLNNFSSLLILAVNPTQTAQTVAPLPRNPLPKRDLRLAASLDEKKAFNEVRHAKCLMKHETYAVGDIMSTELSLVDSLGTVVRALEAVGRHRGYCHRTMQNNFGWLVRWNSLKP